MLSVLNYFHYIRPRSYKPLIDTCFSGNDFSDVSWDMLYDVDGEEVCNRIKKNTEDENKQKRSLMVERAKDRENW